MAASRRSMLRAFVVAALALLFAWFAGGQALLGRIDPALAVPLLTPPMLFLAWWQRDEPVDCRRRTLLIVLLCLAVGQGALAFAFAGSPAAVQLLLSLVAGGLAGWIADILVQRRTWGRGLRLLAGVLLAAGWFAGGHALLAALYRPAAAAGAPAVTMLTSLPLRWSGGGNLAAMIADGPGDDPALVRLEAAGPVSLVDSLVDHVPPRGGALMLAHPRALAPRELVAIDAFVRGGGRAVILADALSGWPARHSFGDPRNPPVTSLLTPLFDHWGVTLGAAPVGETAARPVDVEDARLHLFSAGRFDRLPSTCRAFAVRHIAHCRIGQGEAWLVGDADLIFAPLWRSAVPDMPHLRQADTMEWLAARLWGDAAARAPFRPLWIRVRAE